MAEQRLRGPVIGCLTIDLPREGRPLTRTNWLLRQLADADLRLTAGFPTSAPPARSCSPRLAPPPRLCSLRVTGNVSHAGFRSPWRGRWALNAAVDKEPSSATATACRLLWKHRPDT